MINEKNIEEITRTEFEEKVLEVCYDREMCKRIGADYNRMEEQDLMVIRRYLNQQYNVRD